MQGTKSSQLSKLGFPKFWGRLESKPQFLGFGGLNNFQTPVQNLDPKFSFHKRMSHSEWGVGLGAESQKSNSLFISYKRLS